MRRFLPTSFLATLPLFVGCFDPNITVDTEGSTDPTTSESTTSPLEPPAAEGSTSTGASEDPEASSDDGSTSTGVALDPSTSSTSAASSSSDESSSSGTDGTDSTETGAAAVNDESTTDDACGTELPALLWVEDATITLPMDVAIVSILPDTPLMARSYTAELGAVTFEIDLSCPTELTVFGLVWDLVEGAEPQNADSYYVTVDGLPVPEPTWAYGCETMGLGNESWSWQPLSVWTGMGCSSVPYGIVLDAGLHELTFRNREGGSGGIDAAAIAAIVVTDDPAFDPSTLYDPAGP
jgi:hypothetical protein